MGRTEPSVGRPPASFRRDARAKKAKSTINQLIPSLLPTHPRARLGIEAAELIINPPPLRQTKPSTTDGSSSIPNASGLRITLRVVDALTAAHFLMGNTTEQGLKSTGRVAILNMASPLSPGGGFLNGANSQEESLCMRTTLLPSLKDEHYRLPELGAIYTPDVMVFRDEQADSVLPKKGRWFVDCITAAMLRGPETERDDLGRGRYANDADRELAVQKMRMVLRICQMKGIKKVVLGAWGCGAYGNPVGEVAAAWRKVLLPRVGAKEKNKNKNKRETWGGLEEVVFAIRDAGMAEAFEAAFGDGLLREASPIPVEDEDEEPDTDPKQVETGQLQVKIRELESRIERAADPQVKAGLGSVLSGLIRQLPNHRSRETGQDLLLVQDSSDDEDEESDEDESRTG